jgi:hypothetical protein
MPLLACLSGADSALRSVQHNQPLPKRFTLFKDVYCECYPPMGGLLRRLPKILKRDANLSVGLFHEQIRQEYF